MPEVEQQSEFIKEMQKLVVQQTRQYRQRKDALNKQVYKLFKKKKNLDNNF